MSDIDQKKIASMNETINEYIEFLERLESTTKDSATAKKIREFLIKQKVWKA